MDKLKPVNEKGDDNLKHEQSCLTPLCPTLSLVPHLKHLLSVKPEVIVKVASQEVQVSDEAGSCNSLTMNVWLVLNSPIAENNAEFEAELG